MIVEIIVFYKKVLREYKIRGLNFVLVIRESCIEEIEIRIISRCLLGKGWEREYFRWGNCKCECFEVGRNLVYWKGRKKIMGKG